MNINIQMRYGAYSEYSSRTTKTGKGDTSFEESMKPDSEDTIVRVSIAMAGSGIELENEATGERYSVADLIEMLIRTFIMDIL